VLTSVSIQKYVARMSKVRNEKVKAKEEQDKKPGSGNLWKREVTIPHEPKFRALSGSRPRSNHRSCLSMSKIMSANNISIQNIDFNDSSNDYSQVIILIQLLIIEYHFLLSAENNFVI
jgi:hypothetical protein